MKKLCASPSANALKFAATSLLLALLPAIVSAQAVSFSYAQTPVPTTLPEAYNVALDGVGNIYVADRGAQTISKLPVGGGTPITIASGHVFYGIAADAAGNVFATVSGSTSLLKFPAGGGTPTAIGSFTSQVYSIALDPSGNLYVINGSVLVKVASGGTGTQTSITLNGMNQPAVVTVDTFGNVYVAGADNSTGHIIYKVVEIPASGGPQAIELAPSTGFTGFASNGGFAVDSSGNIFTSDPPNQTITELPAVAPGTLGAPIQLGGGLHGTSGLAADAQNNIYIGDATGLFVFQRNGSVNFGNVNVCAPGQTQPAPCSETATIYYTVTSSGNVGIPTVVTQGSSNLDFTPTGGSFAGSVTAGTVCTVTVRFTPSSTGARSGTLQVLDAKANVIATTNLSGNGIGGASLSFITGQSLGALRNNYSGLVGLVFTTGSTPVQILSLGRFVAPGNTGSHLLKLVQANGVDVPGGSTTVSTAGAVAGQYAYASLASPIILPANTTDYLVSQETAGGDQWYDYGPVTSTTAASVQGPAYTDTNGHYIPVTDFGASYVPLSFLYAPATTAALSVAINSPGLGALLSGTATLTVSTTGPVAALQLQVDGVNYGPAVPVSASQGSTDTLRFDTTSLVTGSHAITVVATDAQMNTATSPAVTVTINNTTATNPSFVMGETLGTLRSNYSGFVGFYMTTGNTPVLVSFLGRYVVPGNSGTHLLKLVNFNGTDVPGGSVSLSLAGATPGTFAYAALPVPISLQPNQPYFLVSQETAGGDQWHDLAPVMTTSVATVTAPVYTDGGGHYVPVSGAAGYSYVPLSFLYGSNVLSATITSPQVGAVVSGSNVPVAVTTTGTFTSLQLQVDGVNQGSPVASSPLTLNTTALINGSHTLTVVATNGTSATAVSAGVAVTVSNGGAAPTAFITGDTPSTLRNNYTGFVGTAITVGSTPLSVTALGRFVVAGNTGLHTVKLVQANGNDVPGGSVTVNTSGATPGQFLYANLASPVALLANTTYYIVSQEGAGGDQWYNLEPVTSTNDAQVLGPVYVDGQGHYVLVGGLTGNSYVPVSFLYQ